MKTHATTKPCAPFVSTLEKLVFENSKGGLFRWYVRKHAEHCGGCKATLDALKCYQDAVKAAFEDVVSEGENVMTADEMTNLLDKLAVGS